jgi:lipoprotein NlpD
LLVKEGVRLSAVKTISELGSTGAQRPMLHFEIRQDGQPVDPLQYLPQP